MIGVHISAAKILQGCRFFFKLKTNIKKDKKKPHFIEASFISKIFKASVFKIKTDLHKMFMVLGFYVI